MQTSECKFRCNTGGVTPTIHLSGSEENIYAYSRMICVLNNNMPCAKMIINRMKWGSSCMIEAMLNLIKIFHCDFIFAFCDNTVWDFLLRAKIFLRLQQKEIPEIATCSCHVNWWSILLGLS